MTVTYPWPLVLNAKQPNLSPAKESAPHYIKNTIESLNSTKVYVERKCLRVKFTAQTLNWVVGTFMAIFTF